MNGELLAVALMAGAANWVFRVLPTMARTDGLPAWLERFLAATGPAAIATLFVAAILPALSGPYLPNAAGIAAVLAVFHASRSVVLATLAGAVAHGLAVWLT